MNKIFYHIGLHKTASTFLQKECAKKQSLLRKEGICFLGAAGCPWDLPWLGKIKKYNQIIASREGIIPYFGKFNRNERNKTLDKLLKIKPNLEKSFIVYLRRQDAFFESYYYLKFKTGEVGSMADFRKKYSPYELAYLELLELFEKKGLDLQVRFYESIFKKGHSHYLIDFVKSSGFKLSPQLINSLKKVPDTHYNIAYGKKTHDLLQEIGRTKGLHEITKRRRSCERWNNSDRIDFLGKERKEILKFYEEENNTIFTKYQTEYRKNLYTWKNRKLLKSKV